MRASLNWLDKGPVEGGGFRAPQQGDELRHVEGRQPSPKDVLDVRLNLSHLIPQLG